MAALIENIFNGLLDVLYIKWNFVHFSVMLDFLLTQLSAFGLQNIIKLYRKVCLFALVVFQESFFYVNIRLIFVCIF